MSQGTVTASSLNVRATPGGTVVGSLAKGAVVTVLQDQGDWLRIQASSVSGYASSQYIQVQTGVAAAAAPSAVPPAAGPDDIKVDGNHAYGPQNVCFAQVCKSGFVNYGETSIAAFLGSQTAPPVDISASRLRVMQAVSANEGKLEALNSWDNCFMSFGAFQWTAGAGSDSGELAALLATLKQTAPDAFREYFGGCGLDVTHLSKPGAGVPTGMLAIDGKTLDSADAKAVLRQPVWAYRFWRAGHDPAVRWAEVCHAASRIDTFYSTSGCAIQGRPVSAYITSEYGVALLLDEHVNRPGHIPGTLAQACQDVVAAGTGADPSGWTDADEQALIARYLVRRAATSMTNSDARAATITAAVKAGQLSDKRGSFA